MPYELGEQLKERHLTTPQTSGPAFEANGDTRVPGFVLPASDLLSEEAAAYQRLRAKMPPFDTHGPDDNAGIPAWRDQLNQFMAPQIAQLRGSFPVEIETQTLGGVEVRSITPAGGGHDPERVLINLHGGAFTVGWDGVALVESIPFAVLGNYRIVTVNYRMAPEYRHPAGVEDAAAVYAALLEHYAPKHIGIYGGSAGGALTAQTAAWLPAHGLPQAGAVGIFGAGGAPFGSGESAHITGYTDGSFAPPPVDGSPGFDITRGYVADTDRTDPSAWPAFDLAVMAKFPPTLIITGTRAMDLSPAIFTNSQLLKAGVRSTMIVGEGMGHCFHYNMAIPEGHDACEIIVRFFRENLA